MSDSAACEAYHDGVTCRTVMCAPCRATNSDVVRERSRIAQLLTRWFDDGCPGAFRTFVQLYLDMDYFEALAEGWMDFTNAVATHEDRLSER